jgi:hypothetical protein
VALVLIDIVRDNCLTVPCDSGRRGKRVTKRGLTQVGAVCLAIQKLGSPSKVSFIRREAIRIIGGPWLDPKLPNLTLMLSGRSSPRGGPQLFYRAGPGLFGLTPDGEKLAARMQAFVGNKRSLETGW